MKNVFALYVICIIAVLGSAGNVGAQSAGSHSTVSAPQPVAGNTSIRQAEQVAASSYSDGASDSPKNELTKTASPETMVPDIYKPFRESYYKTVEIVQISWPHLISGTNGKFGGRLALGLNRPHYLLPKNLKELGVLGSLDLKIDGVIGGVIQSARITIIYDLRRAIKGKDTKASILVDRISFKMGIPVGGW